jgi:hypothetical protein
MRASSAAGGIHAKDDETSRRNKEHNNIYTPVDTVNFIAPFADAARHVRFIRRHRSPLGR